MRILGQFDVGNPLNDPFTNHKNLNYTILRIVAGNVQDVPEFPFIGRHETDGQDIRGLWRSENYLLLEIDIEHF